MIRSLWRWLGPCVVSLMVLLDPATCAAQVDSTLGRQLQRKEVEGEKLSAEERALLDQWLEERRIRTEPARAAYRKAHPPRESTGLVPLTELGTGEYKGDQGGLYPHGSNRAPESHLRAGLERAREIAPLDAEGRPAPDGKIVLLSIGMSNTSGEFQGLRILTRTDPEVNPRVVLVDGAQGSRAAPHTARPDSPYWEVVNARLGEADATPAQVQVVWMKQVTANPQRPFPEEAKVLKDALASAMAILADRFPNLKIVFLSSRVYGGYAETRLHPEPHAYETAFAVKWLIAEQIDGAAALNFDPQRGPVRSPWLAWGPYLWADGVRPRSDGLVYHRDDFAIDGIHPSASGRRKVGEKLLTFFKSEPTTRSWFVRRTP